MSSLDEERTGPASPSPPLPLEGAASAPLATRGTLERATAAGISVFGLVIAGGSLTDDIGWNGTRPGAGYFPFRVGLLLAAAGIVLFLQHRRSAADTFVTAAQFARAWSVFWPAAVLVAAMYPFGWYVPSGAYLAWMMRSHGGYGWPRAISTAALFIAAFYIVFELGFNVPLAKGPVFEGLFGLP